MITTRQLISFAVGASLLLTFACKKDKAIITEVPELSTTEVTNILATTAVSGGNITSNGGAEIAASGICWSKINNTPTISDDTTKSTIATGSFIAMMKDLSPSATYYVRSYATNRMGTGYGNVITFSTGNAAPIATAVSISGDAKGDALLTGNYTYSDPEGNTESGTIFQWYMANDATGTGEAVISGATAKTFRVTDAQQGKYVRFGVTPKASTGNLTGMEVKSTFIGAVGQATTVTFTYNGAEVTYGILNSTATGKKWLDRNLGASRVATALDDWRAYGDLFQWGRLADGHQLITRTGPNGTDASGITGTTSAIKPYETSATNVPSTNKFILNGDGISDWLTTQNDMLWQGVSGINNPCPAGWRIPTQAEYVAEGFTSGVDAFTKLKFTLTGQREPDPFATVKGAIVSANFGVYWSSTIRTSSISPGYIRRLIIDATTADAGNFSYGSRGMALGCRCIKE